MHWELLKEALPILAVGYPGVFIVTAILVGMVSLLAGKEAGENP